MKKPSKSKAAEHPVIASELHHRLAEFEAEIRAYPTRAEDQRILKAVEDAAEAVIEKENVIQFSLFGKNFAAGHGDLTYSGSNHARGVRHIRFYADGKMVLEIEGDFEDQQFGSNFRFHNIDHYTPGEWEASLIKVTDELRQFIAKRKIAFKKKRDAANARR